tara:strand:- start:378 stop:1325 length:948 start_codon:yes stop_codon:yes gene_type:complete
MTKHEFLAERPQSITHENDEIDLRQVFEVLWRGKWIVLGITILFTVAGVAYALSRPDIYKASVLLAPAKEESSAASISGQLGGLASLAGINLSGGSSSQTVIAKEILQSRAFLSHFIRYHGLSVPLMASKAWDMSRGRWIIDEALYNQETREWRKDNNGKSKKPTDWDMVKKFKEDNLSLSEDKETGMLTLNLKSLSPVAAQQWATLLVQDLNETIRDRDIKEAEARIAYLEAKLSETNIAGMQQVFYQLIESETRTVMLANAQDEYVFKVIDPAMIPQEKSEPKRALMVMMIAMLGIFLGMLTVFIKELISKDK